MSDLLVVADRFAELAGRDGVLTVTEVVRALPIVSATGTPLLLRLGHGVGTPERDALWDAVARAGMTERTALLAQTGPTVRKGPIR
ncbi:hypothetical protein [Catenuloplanes japonicus]|uniref:hypothetical protein n=1 Tax=Catenuloplanes japonicus TaxID=33876 RepID=UPI000527DB28|nr:hypothetical protein [Catenuloplanes japonicus]